MGTQNTPPYFMKGPRVGLAPTSIDNLPLYLKWANDPEVRVFLAHSTPFSEKKEREWVESCNSKDTQISLTIYVLDTHTPIGNITLGYNPATKVGNTGAMIGEKDYWNKGYGTEAKMLVLKYGFDHLGLRKVNSAVWSSNPRSLAYQKKHGARVVGVRKKQALRGGKYVDEIMLDTWAKDFKRVWKAWSRGKSISL